MDLREQLRRHRKDNRLIVGGLAALLVVFTAGFYLLQRTRELPAALVTNRVLLFVLWYVNVVLILTILFVLLRNFFKLLMERHHRILGSKFKTKLVLTYVGLSLIPVLLLFVISTQLLRGSIERWFSTPLEEILPLGNAVAQELHLTTERFDLRDATIVLGEVAGKDLAAPEARRVLQRRLRELLQQLALDFLAVYEYRPAEDRIDLVHAVVNAEANLGDLPEPAKGFLREAALNGSARGQPPAKVEGTLILGAVSPGLGAGEAVPIVVAGRLLDPVFAAQSRRLIEAYQTHRQLEVQREDLKASYLLIFLMLTLLILLASSWVGLYLARRVTVPIQALADGTRRISSGDLDHRVEVAADDELGVLVDSFNRMTAELAGSKELLEAGNRELSATNERLAEERALIAAVLQNVAAGVISVDAEGRIFTCNGAALTMLRQREDEVLGRPVQEAWADPERRKLAALFDEPAAAPPRLSKEVHLILGGEWKTFEVKLTTTRGAAGEPRVRVVVLEDLSELIKAQQLAAWREAARRIAHEIKNPLTPIRLAAERLLAKHRRSDAELGSALEEGVEIITREVRTLQGMVDEFSRYARMPRPQPARVDLVRLMDDTLHLYRDLKPGVELAWEVADEVAEAWVDAEQLRRALINLLDNALEATTPPGSVRVAARRDDGHLRIDVADTGRGIPAESKDKLFLPYFSTKGRGTGLGLAIVHRIVTDHHGRIWAEDNQPQGTVFTIELPLE
jgi:two-component system, NtrC family, nitrogen regulation sensor histidine kinase NtrY